MKIKFTKIAKGIQKFMSKRHLESLARQHLFVQRKSPLMGFDFVQCCISSIKEEGVSSLTEMRASLLELDVNIAKSSLDERFNKKSESFLKALFEQMLSTHLGDKTVMELGNKLDYFKNIYVRDATITTLPNNLEALYKGTGGSGNSSNSSLKTDLLFNLKGNDCLFYFRDGASSDGNAPDIPLEKGSLYLFDLGYFKLGRFAKMVDIGAYFVSRYKFNNNLYDSKDSKNPIDLQAFVQEMEASQLKDIQVFMGAKARVPVRFIVQRLSDELTQQRREKLIKEKKKKSKNVSEQRLDFCALQAYITNLPTKDWTPDEVMGLYPIRWQIEILYKAWKSVFKFRNFHKMKPQRFMCLLYAQMIWLLINMKVFQTFKILVWNKYKIELSELKAYKILKIYSHVIMQALKENCLKKFIKFLNLAYKACFFFAEKEAKKKRKSALCYFESS